MKFHKSLCCLLLTASIAANTAAQQIDPMTRAMLNAYGELIKENPKDYQTLYERAAQYYTLYQYDNALNDLTQALKYTPVKEKDLRMSELKLMADVATQVENYDLALSTINEALELDPSNYANVYKKGNILLYLNRPEEAYRTFSSMQSLKSRSQEAYFGMAKALIMQKKYAEAEDLMKEAENADPTGYLTYCRLGDLYLDMEQPENAATNYLLAFNLGAGKSSRPLESLVELAANNYNAVATALDFAIDKSDNKVPNLFLKGNIAYESGNYSQADAAFAQLIEFPEAQAASIYAQYANTKLAMADLKAAKEYITKAIEMNPAADYYITKSLMDVANGNPAEGVVDASTALQSDPNSVDAMIAKAKAQLALQDSKGAMETLNMAIMTAPDRQDALLLRAYVSEEMANNAKGAVGDFNRIILEDSFAFPALTYKALAQAKTGKKLDADTTIEKGLEGNPGKDALYWAAVYNAQTGNLEKAKELADKAIFAGYQNQYNLKINNTPWLTLAPIRHLLK